MANVEFHADTTTTDKSFRLELWRGGAKVNAALGSITLGSDKFETGAKINQTANPNATVTMGYP